MCKRTHSPWELEIRPAEERAKSDAENNDRFLELIQEKTGAYYDAEEIS